MTTYVQHPDFRIVNLLFGLSTKYNKLWCYPSQDKIAELIARFHGRSMSRRTVNRHLGGLARDGWIKRVRRHRRCPVHGFTFHSTLYCITRKTLRAFAGLKQATRFIGAALRDRAAQKPCANNGTISVPVVQSNGPGAPSAPPDNNNRVAVEQLDRIKGLLRR
jgi:hypothetical protein